MNIEILKQEKDEVELRIDNPTVAEVMREYLNRQKIEFAAWRREHPSKPLIMKIVVSSGTVKKAVSDAVKEIKKDLSEFNKIKK
jgi:DNA-directed RNA polymerase subunit L